VVVLSGAKIDKGTLPLKLINGSMENKYFYLTLVRNVVPDGLKLLKNVGPARGVPSITTPIDTPPF